MNESHPKYLAAALASVYFLWCAATPYEWKFLDGVNLIIHEAGHMVFMPFGEFMMIAGGSLFQVIMPAAFVYYFFRECKFFSASLVLFWVGQSLINVSVYANDAQAMNLPLLGGGDAIHDWNYLLSVTGLLPQTDLISGLIRASATLTIVGAAILSFAYAGSSAGKSSYDYR